ncbi:unnamed protein product [Dicrocoelium dendriticum]|nr:unnamed protein product [Dicrocoelium dendriticum]
MREEIGSSIMESSHLTSIKNRLLSSEKFNRSLLNTRAPPWAFQSINSPVLSTFSRLLDINFDVDKGILHSAPLKTKETVDSKPNGDNDKAIHTDQAQLSCSWFKPASVPSEIVAFVPTVVSEQDTFLPKLLNVGSFTGAFKKDTHAHTIFKSELLQLVASSIAEGGFLKKAETKALFGQLLNCCSVSDPEFILKVAVYCRLELNIRTTANLLMAYGCIAKSCHPFIDKYFSAVICLPTDWTEVAEYYEAMCYVLGKKPSYPKVLRRNMVQKFLEFDEYQLAKYNRKKSRLGHKRKMIDMRSETASEPVPVSELLKHLRPIPVTFQYLIRLLHIHRPTSSVMCLLGKTYPTNASDFFKAGMDGVWDSTLSGTRMKLPTPLTWETELSTNKNCALVWEKIISSGKLPYMAMLRNLRNIIKCGVNMDTQEEIIKKLTNPHSIIASKQFPFRFFSAYAVLDQLEQNLRYNGFLIRQARRSRRKGTSEKEKSNDIKNKCICRLPYSSELLRAYRLALNVAVDISIRHSLHPIRGSTLIVCSVKDERNNTCISRGMGKNLRSIGILLGMMCATCCESCSMYVSRPDGTGLIPLHQYMRHGCSPTSDDSILGMVQSLCTTEDVSYCLTAEDLVQYLCSSRQQLRTIFLIGSMIPELSLYVTNYRQIFGRINAIWGNLKGTDDWPNAAGDPKDWVIMKGTTDMVLRYIAEASDKGLLERVERIDELYGLTTRSRAVSSKLQSLQPDIPLDRPLNEWRSCKIFISSTFRDMHAERDLICGVIIPSIRQFAARELCVHVDEVDLRWGVPEIATRSPRALEMCLEHAATADIFVLLAGGRYGWVPKPALLDRLSEPLLSQIKKLHQPGMSVTELEYRIIKQAIVLRVPPHLRRKGAFDEKEAVTRRVFAFLRDSDSLRSVPEIHLPDFEEQHAEKYKRLQAFKTLLKNDGVVVSENYPAWYNGVVTNRPVMGNLTQFAKELTDCLRNALREQFKPQVLEPSSPRHLEISARAISHDKFLATYVSPIAYSISSRQLLELKRAFLELDVRGKQCHTLRMFADQKNAANAGKNFNMEHKIEADGAILLITGSHGSGKTTHLAALTMLLRYPHWQPQQFSKDFPPKMASLLGSTGLRSTYTVSAESDTLSSNLVGYIVLPHFVEGVAASGLPPNFRLVSLLDDWSDQLVHCAELLSQYSPIAEKKLNKLKNSSDNMDTRSSDASLDALLRSKVSRFTELLKLSSMFPTMRYAFMVDAVDRLQPFTLDWLPEILPENVRFIFSCDAKSAAARQLATRPDCIAFTISGLNLMERKAAIRNLFGRYGKVLRESAIGNQLSVLANKRNAELPLYLRLACDELRLYGTYEELDNQLKALPSTIPSLVQCVIARTETECGSRITLATLAFICCSRRPLTMEELHILLDTWLADPNHISEEPKTGESLTWSSLCHGLCDLSDSKEMLERELLIAQLLSSNWSVQSKTVQLQGHLPSLAFTILIRRLSPLFAGFGDQSDDIHADEESIVSDEHLKLRGLIRFRSEDIASVVREVVFGKVDRLHSYSLLGFHRPTSAYATNFQNKRFRPEKLEDTEEIKEIDEKYVHWILATKLIDPRDIIHHFIRAGKLTIAHQLLTSAVFLVEKLRTGLGDSIMEDFDECESSDSAQQSFWKWDNASQPNKTRDRLKSMLWFIGANLPFLTRYPCLFGELCINNRSSSWIQQLGFAYLTLSASQKCKENGPDVRLLVRRSHASDFTDEARRLAPVVVQNPASTSQITEAPTTVTVSPNGQLLVYGSQSGSITVVELKTLRVLRSLFGHRSAVLCLCFLSTEESSADFRSDIKSFSNDSRFRLASTAQDSSVYLWDIAIGLNSLGKCELTTGAKIASLGGSHRNAVTSCAWHPGRHILVTGGLDCQIILWTLPTNLDDLTRLQFGSQSSLPPHKSMSDGLGPVSAVAFRLPESDHSASSHPRDVLAVGSWDGTVHILDMVTWRFCKRLHVSSSAISSIAYSLDGGAVLATQDVAGQLFLWNSDTYSLLSGITPKLTRLPTGDENETPDLSDCLSGQICFSRPHGHFLIQSGGIHNKNGQISVWNAQLGNYLSPWRNSSSWRHGTHSVAEVTSFDTDPFGHISVVGTNDGVFALICSRSSTVLYSAAQNTRSRLQACSCGVIANNVENTYRLLVALGFSSGLVQVYVADIIRPNNFNTHDISANCTCRLSAINLLHSSFHHTDAATGTAVARGGGTLCTAMEGFAIASGGGDGSCYLNFFHEGEDGTVQHVNCLKLPEFQSAVTAISLGGSLLAVGTKLRILKIFALMEDSTLTSFCPDVINAANDWITALAWDIISPVQHYLLVGSNDHMVRLYAVFKENMPQLLDTVDGPGGVISCLSSEAQYVAAGSAEGAVKIWRRTKENRLEHVSRLDFSEQPTDGRTGRIVNLKLFGINSTETRQFAPLAKLSDEVTMTIDNYHALMSLPFVPTNDEKTELIPSLKACSLSTSNEDVPPAYTLEQEGESEVDKYSATATNASELESELATVEMSDECTVVSQEESPQTNPAALAGIFRCLPKKRRSCIFSIGQNRRSISSQARTASSLRLIVGQHIMPNALSTKLSSDILRFRFLAPLMLECRALLDGHPVSVATGLATCDPTNSGSDSLLVSVAPRDELCESMQGHDVRYWWLPSSQDSATATPLQHSDRVTCLAGVQLSDANYLLLSGGADGCVLFWHSTSERQANELGHILSPLNSCKQEGWAPAFKIIFDSLNQSLAPIIAILAIASAEVITVCVATGQQVWHLTIPEKSFPILEQWASMSVDKLQQISQDMKAEDRPKLNSLSLNSAIIDMCFMRPVDSSNEDAKLLLSLCNGDLAIIPHGLHTANTETCNVTQLKSATEPKGHWLISCHEYQRSIVAVHKGTPVKVSLEANQFTADQLFPTGALDPNEHIQCISVVPAVYLKELQTFYLVTSRIGEEARLKLLDARGIIAGQSEPIRTPLTITASCHLSPDDGGVHFASELLHFVLATSDGLLVVLEFNTSEAYRPSGKMMRPIALYPTGEYITQLQLIPRLPRHFLTGSRSGRMNIFALL